MTEAIPTQAATTPRKLSTSLSVWQDFVYSPGASELSSSSIDTLSNGIDALRIDPATAAVPAPALQTTWTTAIGWHDTLETPAIQIDSDSDSQTNETVAQRSTVEPNLGELFAEVAHDIRAPIAIARQIVSAVAQNARASGSLDSGEVELLDVANMRLQEANQWAEGVLIGRCLETGTPVTIRKRFYPTQWRQVAQPLLESVAARKDIQLNWIGWDRSLPRLYLDEGQLTRVMLNLVSNAVQASGSGKRICIRVGVQNNVTQRLILAVEDEGVGIDDHLMHQFNSGSQQITASASVGTGLGLRTARSLIVANGGDATVARAPGGGTLVRITLPSDNPASLIRSWIVDNAPMLGRPSRVLRRPELKMYAVRIAGMESEFCDAQLQQNADATSWVYRVGRDRWIWLAIVEGDKNRELPEDLERALKQLKSLKHPRLQDSASVHLAYSLKNFLQASGASRQLTRRRISELTALLAGQVDRLTGEKIPSVDNIQGGNTRMIFRGESGTRQVRQDEASSTPLPKFLRKPRRRDTQIEMPQEMPTHAPAPHRASPTLSAANAMRRMDEGVTATGPAPSISSTGAASSDTMPASKMHGRTDSGADSGQPVPGTPKPKLGGAPTVESTGHGSATAVAAPKTAITPAARTPAAPQVTPILARMPESKLEVQKGIEAPSWTVLASQFRVDQAAIDGAHQFMTDPQ